MIRGAYGIARHGSRRLRSVGVVERVGVCPRDMKPADSQLGNKQPYRRSTALLVLAAVMSGAICFASRSVRAEDQQSARLQLLIETARLARLNWEEAKNANRKAPGTIPRGELRRLELQTELAELEVKVLGTERTDLKTMRALNTRTAIIDLELALLEIERAQVASNRDEVHRLKPARQSAIRALRQLHDVGPAAKDGVPALVAALDDPELARYARCALRRISPAALKETLEKAINKEAVDGVKPEVPVEPGRHR